MRASASLSAAPAGHVVAGRARAAARLCCVVVAAGLLAGCGTFSTGIFTIEQDLARLKQTTPQGSPFTRALATEYRSFATFEAEEMMDWPDAAHFTAKGLEAARGTVVQPEPLESWRLPEKERPALASARSRLVAALDGGGREGKPEIAARAQAKFDCWVEQQEENWQWDHIAACRDQFEAAMRELEARPAAQQPPPAPAPAPQPAAPTARRFLVFFDFDRADITPEARGIIEQAARAGQALGNARVSVTGHADRSGPDAYNLRLSERRARNVVNELVRRGIAAQRMSVSAKGESEPLVPTPDGVREPQNRRVEIVY